MHWRDEPQISTNHAQMLLKFWMFRPKHSAQSLISYPIKKKRNECNWYWRCLFHLFLGNWPGIPNQKLDGSSHYINVFSVEKKYKWSHILENLATFAWRYQQRFFTSSIYGIDYKNFENFAQKKYVSRKNLEADEAKL